MKTKQFTLCLHIGFPKTGSTYLQEVIFKDVSGFLGKNGNDVSDNTFANRFNRILPVAPLKSMGDPGAGLWWEDVKAFAQNTWPECRQLILSDEWLTRRCSRQDHEAAPIGYNRDYLNPGWFGLKHGHSDFEKFVMKDDVLDLERPLIQFLQHAVRQWSNLEKIKVVMVVRNQADWLASRYVQRSWRNPRASQHDFEEQVSHVLKNHLPYIDWCDWCEKLQQVLGSENVKVLLYEEIQTEQFFQNLSDFLDHPSILQNWRQSGNSRKNVRREVSGSEVRWKIRPYGGEDEKYSVLAMRLADRWPQVILASMRNRVIRFSDKLSRSSGYDSRLKQRLNAQRGEYITISPELKTSIQTATQNGNQRLEKLLGRDLKQFGY